jgi:hypothetical protein
MKHCLYLILMLVLFMSCQSNTKPGNQDTIATNGANIQTQALIKEFLPLINGSWVKKEYIDKIIKTKSPAQAADLAKGLTTMTILTDYLKGDSIIVDAGWENHEGGDLTLKFKPGKTQGSIVLGAFDLKYSVTAHDTTLMLYEYDNEKKTIKVTKYERAFADKPGYLGSGTDYLINKAIIAGKYMATDSIGNETKVVFTATGKISGLANFSTYYIFDDLNSDPMTNLDEVIFDTFSKQKLEYTFKINADTLRLFDIKANADSTEALVGKLKYKLVRQR